MRKGSEEKSSMELILDSLASPVRIRILRNLSQKSMNYSELMEALGMDRDRDAGKFSYHLKKLLNAGLIAVDHKSRRYSLSRRGSTVLEYLENLERELGERRLMIVRRSDQVIEPFDKEKIAKALVREAKLTPRLAREIASIAERKLLDLRIDYLTAPLIRELVNTILLDMGLEKYRHRLTRIGMPVYDVSRLLHRAYKMRDCRIFLERSSASMIREYTILYMLPREVAELHLSGRIDLYPLSSWLVGVFARYYRLDRSNFLDLLAQIMGELLCVRKEVRLRLEREMESELQKSFIESIVRNISGSRVLSIDLYGQELRKILHDLDGSFRKKIGVVVDLSTSSSKFFKSRLEELHKSGVQAIYSFGGDIFLSGYKFTSSLTTLHSIGTINLLAAALESRGDLDGLLTRIEEDLRRLVSALLKGLRVVEKIHGRDDEVYSAVSLSGLMEASRYITGIASVVSEEAVSTAKTILKNVENLLKRFGQGRIRLVGRCPRSAAKRFMKIDSYRFGRERITKLIGGSDRYSYLLISPKERFRSLADRFEADLELAPLTEFGYPIAVGFRKGIRAYRELFSHLERVCKTNPSASLILV